MAIKFLHDHSVGEGKDRESFKEGQIVTDRTPDSEAGFVRRGHAAFIRGNKLLDHEERVIGAAPAKKAAPRKRSKAKVPAPKKAAAAAKPAPAKASPKKPATPRRRDPAAAAMKSTK